MQIDNYLHPIELCVYKNTLIAFADCKEQPKTLNLSEIGYPPINKDVNFGRFPPILHLFWDTINILIKNKTLIFHYAQVPADFDKIWVNQLKAEDPLNDIVNFKKKVDWGEFYGLISRSFKMYPSFVVSSSGYGRSSRLISYDHYYQNVNVGLSISTNAYNTIETALDTYTANHVAQELPRKQGELFFSYEVHKKEALQIINSKKTSYGLKQLEIKKEEFWVEYASCGYEKSQQQTKFHETFLALEKEGIIKIRSSYYDGVIFDSLKKSGGVSNTNTEHVKFISGLSKENLSKVINILEVILDHLELESQDSKFIRIPFSKFKDAGIDISKYGEEIGRIVDKLQKEKNDLIINQFSPLLHQYKNDPYSAATVAKSLEENLIISVPNRIRLKSFFQDLKTEAITKKPNPDKNTIKFDEINLIFDGQLIYQRDHRDVSFSPRAGIGLDILQYFNSNREKKSVIFRDVNVKIRLDSSSYENIIKNWSKRLNIEGADLKKIINFTSGTLTISDKLQFKN